MYLSLTLRIQRAKQNAIRLQNQHGSADRTYPVIPEELILSQLGQKLVVDCSAGLIITESGFITMALFAEEAQYCQGMLVIPGIDDQKQFGYLVLRDGFVPFHSMATSIGRAAVDAKRAWERSSKLVEHFGSKSALKQAAASAPWYLMSRIEDATSAGLCQWGIDSFLRRLYLRRISDLIGLPQCLVRLAGAYGCRVSAATLVRLDHHLSKASITEEKLK